ncbi:hypothetical protein C5613_42870 [Rhodococcus opacus]|uniref:Uncharacterized protein n=1 Tax=Rhodococcus opacus TaxID=37919 RepID=A0A2S8IBW0_RHOOP|nr:hypothetical protein C5613_42870 [Rhodococcus opacus]
MTRLNEVIAADPHLGKDYCIGHSYFTCATRLARVLVASAACRRDFASNRVEPHRSLAVASRRLDCGLRTHFTRRFRDASA